MNFIKKLSSLPSKTTCWQFRYYRNISQNFPNILNKSVMPQKSIRSFFQKTPKIIKQDDVTKKEVEELKTEIKGDVEATKIKNIKQQPKKTNDKKIKVEKKKDLEKSPNKQHEDKDLNQKIEDLEDSPVKIKRSKKRKLCLESSSEDEVVEEIRLSEKTPIKKKKASSKLKSPSTKVVSPKSLDVKSDDEDIEMDDKSDSDKEIAGNDKAIESEEEKQQTEPKSKSCFFNKQILQSSSSKVVYEPGLNKYDPVKHSCWKRGEKIPYIALAQTFKLIEETSGRLRIVEILRNFFRSVIILSPEELVTCVHLSLNRLAAAYEGVELGIGDMVLTKAVSEATSRKVSQIREDVKKLGDLGLVAEKSKSGQKLMFSPPRLTIDGVFKKMKQIAATSGSSSMNQKVVVIKNLMVACKDCESRYLIRSLSGKLRIGLAEQSVLTALAHALVLSPPGQNYPPKVLNYGKNKSNEKLKIVLDEKTLLLKMCYCEMPNYEILISSVLKHGLDELPKHCKLTPGIPLKPMLAHPTKGISQVLDRFNESVFTCEYKYDGERAQIHLLEDGQVMIYSRNQENNTTKYPDIIERLPQVLKEGVTSCVIDSEAVAWDSEQKQILPFQVLTTRKRKDADKSEIKVQVCIYAFDLLYLNGKSLVREPFRKRRELLRENFTEKEGEFVFATCQDTTDTDEISDLLDQSIKGNCEGLMVKTLDTDATYEIAKRSHNWLKLKKDYLDGVGDTLDLVVIGAVKGKGKRVGNYGNFLLACYDPESEEYQTICKIGTGFTDQDLKDHTSFFKDHKMTEPKSYYRLNGCTADDWFEPVQVWEVKAADLSISPVYAAAAGIVDPEKGISLRFPRFLRIRDDKNPEDATSSLQVADLYEKQQQVVNNQKGRNGNSNFDFY